MAARPDYAPESILETFILPYGKTSSKIFHIVQWHGYPLDTGSPLSEDAIPAIDDRTWLNESQQLNLSDITRFPSSRSLTPFASPTKLEQQIHTLLLEQQLIDNEYNIQFPERHVLRQFVNLGDAPFPGRSRYVLWMLLLSIDSQFVTKRWKEYRLADNSTAVGAEVCFRVTIRDQETFAATWGDVPQRLNTIVDLSRDDLAIINAPRFSMVPVGNNPSIIENIRASHGIPSDTTIHVIPFHINNDLLNRDHVQVVQGILDLVVVEYLVVLYPDNDTLAHHPFFATDQTFPKDTKDFHDRFYYMFNDILDITTQETVDKILPLWANQQKSSLLSVFERSIEDGNTQPSSSNASSSNALSEVLQEMIDDEDFDELDDEDDFSVLFTQETTTPQETTTQQPTTTPQQPTTTPQQPTTTPQVAYTPSYEPRTQDTLSVLYCPIIYHAILFMMPSLGYPVQSSALPYRFPIVFGRHLHDQIAAHFQLGPNVPVETLNHDQLREFHAYLYRRGVHIAESSEFPLRRIQYLFQRVMMNLKRHNIPYWRRVIDTYTSSSVSHVVSHYLMDPRIHELYTDDLVADETAAYNSIVNSLIQDIGMYIRHRLMHGWNGSISPAQLAVQRVFRQFADASNAIPHFQNADQDAIIYQGSILSMVRCSPYRGGTRSVDDRRYSIIRPVAFRDGELLGASAQDMFATIDNLYNDMTRTQYYLWAGSQQPVQFTTRNVSRVLDWLDNGHVNTNLSEPLVPYTELNGWATAVFNLPRNGARVTQQYGLMDYMIDQSQVDPDQFWNANVSLDEGLTTTHLYIQNRNRNELRAMNAQRMQQQQTTRPRLSITRTPDPQFRLDEEVEWNDGTTVERYTVVGGPDWIEEAGLDPGWTYRLQDNDGDFYRARESDMDRVVEPPQEPTINREDAREAREARERHRQQQRVTAERDREQSEQSQPQDDTLVWVRLGLLRNRDATAYNGRRVRYAGRNTYQGQLVVENRNQLSILFNNPNSDFGRRGEHRFGTVSGFCVFLKNLYTSPNDTPIDAEHNVRRPANPRRVTQQNDELWSNRYGHVCNGFRSLQIQIPRLHVANGSLEDQYAPPLQGGGDDMSSSDEEYQPFGRRHIVS